MSDEKKVSRLLQLAEYLKKVRDPWEDDWQDILDYMLPRKNDLTWSPSKKGKRDNKQIYDSTAQNSIEIVANGLQGYQTPQSGNWFRLSLPIEQLESAPGVRRFLQDTERALYDELARSNFYHMLSEAYPTVVSLGTVTAALEENIEAGNMLYITMDPKEMYIHENHVQIVDTHVRKYWLTIANMIERFGNNVPENISRRAEDNPFEEMLVLHIVLPRKKRDPYKVDKLNKPFASYHILEEDRVLLDESGFDQNPFTTMRLQNNSGEIYGKGWGYDVLPETLRLQQIAKQKMRMGHLASDPPYSYPAEQEGLLDLGPGGMNPYTDPQRPIQRINLLGDYPITREEQNDVRLQVREKLMVDFFISLQQMQGNRTATEVMEMQGEKAAILSTISNRIYTEFLTPLLVKTWRIAYWAGRMPEIPGVLHRHGVTGLKIDFVGPLAQIQKRYHAFQGVEQTLTRFMPLIEAFPSLIDLINADELGRHILNEGGFPQKAVNDMRIVKEARAAKAQQAAQMQQMEQAQALAEMAPKLNQPVKPGSPLEAMEQAANSGGTA